MLLAILLLPQRVTRQGSLVFHTHTHWCTRPSLFKVNQLTSKGLRYPSQPASMATLSMEGQYFFLMWFTSWCLYSENLALFLKTQLFSCLDFKVMYSMDALLKSVCYRWFVCLLRCWQQCFQQMLVLLHSLYPSANPSIILFYNWHCVIFFLLFIFLGLVSIIACCWQRHANTLCCSWLLPRMGLSKLCYSLAHFFPLFLWALRKLIS